ncbi:MAG TPA: ester cyclase [Solirubrobacteraceae bacterium]|nr:ester cyclase [Solirubrobacteraceae bacterium]
MAAMTSGHVDQLADEWEAAWSSGDARSFLALCAPDLHYEDPVTSAPLQGVAALSEHAERLWRAFPELHLERAGERLSDGRFAALPVRVRGRNTGDLDGLPASHREISVHAVFWCELDLGRTRMWRVRTVFDAYGAAVSLGLLPRPGSLRNRAILALQGYGIRLGG